MDSSWLLLYQVERAPWEDQSLIGSAVEIEKILTRDPCSVGPRAEGSTSGSSEQGYERKEFHLSGVLENRLTRYLCKYHS